MNNQNPFAPPLAIESASHADLNSAIYRDGSFLVIQNGAQLPKICFVTGQATGVSFNWRTSFAPRWHFALLLLGILPYFIIGPFLFSSIQITVPCSPDLLVRINRRSILVKVLYLASIGSLLLAANEISSDMFTIVFFGCAILAFLIASMLRKGGNLLGLKVVRVSGNELWLSGVHPNFLSDLPDY